MTVRRRCVYCGKEFEAKTRKAKFCSTRCRVAANREGIVVTRTPGKPSATMAREAVAQLRADADAFRDLAGRGPKRYRERCAAVASGIDGLIEEADL